MQLSPEGEVEARSGTHKYGYDGNWKFQMENGVDGYHPNFVHQAFFEGRSRKAMQLFTGNAEYESKDLGNGHAILDMAPKHRSPGRPVSNLLRGTMFNRCSAGLRVKGAEWLELSRGIDREREDCNGVLIGHITDETPQRAFYRRWRALMLDAAQPRQRSARLSASQGRPRG